MLRYTLAISALFGIVSYMFVGNVVKRFGARSMLFLGIAAYGIMYLGMGAMQSPLATAIVFALPLFGLTNVSANTLAAEYSSESQRGGGLGVLSGTIALSTTAGPLIGGALADRVGLQVIPWVALAFVTAALPFMLWVVKGRVPAAIPQES
jgi:MFS family permease